MDDFSTILTINVSAARYGVVAFAAIAAGVTDLLWLRIFNVLTIPLIVSGVIYHAAIPAGEGVLFTLAGAGCGFGILGLLFAAGGVGAGDVKLLTGVGAWIGSHDVLVVFVVAGLLNGLYSLVMITSTNSWKELRGRLGDACRRFPGRKRRQSESVEQIAGQDEQTRRRRLAPMGTMIACSLLILLIRSLLSSPPSVESHARQVAPASASYR